MGPKPTGGYRNWGRTFSAISSKLSWNSRAVLGLVGTVGLWLLRPLLLALGHVAALLVQLGNWLSAMFGGGDLTGLELAQSQIREFHESLEQVEDGGPPTFLVSLLKGLAFFVAAGLASWLLFRLFRFRRYLRRQGEVEETRESMFSWTKANNDLSDMLAISGGLIAGALFELMKYAFTFYVTELVHYERLYGALGALPVFLIWLYLIWVVVLMGSEIAFCLQHPEQSHSRHVTYLPVFMPLTRLPGKYATCYSVICCQPATKKWKSTWVVLRAKQPRFPSLVLSDSCLQPRHC